MSKFLRSSSQQEEVVENPIRSFARRSGGAARCCKCAFVARPALVAGLCAAMLAGCADVSMRPYERPESPAKSTWSRQQAASVSASETITPEWWKGFKDPQLDSLVSKAIAGNFDVKILAARTQVAKAGIGEARAGAQPFVDVGGGASFEKSTKQDVVKQFNLATQVNWELDIWGKVEKGVQAQTAEFRATEADWRAGYLTLVAGVSSTYFQILQFDEQINQQQQALAKNKQILTIFEAMSANGVAPKTQVLRQRAEVNKLTNDLVELRRLRDVSENALATLMGVPAGEFKLAPGRLQERVAILPVPSGLPSQLLSRRPDIIAAEYRVLEAYDLVGQAKLAQLPSISLTARGGTSSFQLTDLLKSFTFGFLPSINLPIFDPSVKARIKTTEAQTTVAEEQYRKTVITAFEEVENALVNLDARKQQRTELLEQVGHLKTVAAQTEAQLREGVISQLEVFENERSLLSAQLALLANHQQILSDTVTLYKVLGGGWPGVVVKNESE